MTFFDRRMSLIASQSGGNLPPIGITLQEATWEQISSVSKAGKASQYWAVGDTKNIYINNVSWDVEILDFSHDDLPSGGKAGITFGTVKLPTAARMHNNGTTGGWEQCQMRVTTMPLLYGQLNADLVNVIQPVYKYSASKGGSGATLVTTTDSLFIPSVIEVTGNTSLGFAGEGTQYARFASLTNWQKFPATGANNWWLRTPYKLYWYEIQSNGVFTNMSYADAASQFGVCLCFCV